VEARRDVTESGLRLVLIVAGVMLAALMQTLDTTITNVALPNIQGNLGASQDEGTWVVTAYTIAAIIVIPLTPWLQGRFGRKNYFLASIAGFTVASMLCAWSGSLDQLVGARVVQGAFGGGLLATSQSILRDSFPPKHLGLSQGIFAIGAVMGPALGPPLGGFLVDNASWNWAFEINLVPGTIAIVLLFLLLRDPEAKRKLPIDAPGLALLAVMLGTLQYVLTEGERRDWLSDPAIAWSTAVCAFSFTGFAWWELFGTKTPVVDLRILTNRSVAAGTILSMVIGVAALGSSYTLPQLTQGPLGFSPSLSGFLFLVRAFPIMLATLPLVFLASKIDTRILVGFGFLVVGISSGLLASATTSDSSFGTFVLPLILSGIGIVTLYIPLSIAVLGATTPEQGPKASSFLNLALQLGGSAGIAALTVFVDQREAFHSTILAGAATLGGLSDRGYAAGPAQITQLAHLIDTQSTVLSYADASYLIALLGVVCIPLVFLLRRPKTARRTAEISE
ncbi:MAG: drug resistance transporter, EmrB/QacA subfamily, partial [Candidatus Eremiobacteraeota bacterium]|nr:drug resistance transporter, EmrB/QacA subfamily [Candidatus Eremiobacteraeota bacterium]